MRAVVPAQDDRPRSRVAVPEVEDVVDRGAAERVDRLVVVADHGDVPVGLGEQGHQLGLRPVRVLELVDEDVAEPAGDLGARRGGAPDEAQGERHLVAEVDAAVGREQLLIRRVGPGELVLPGGLLAPRRGRIGVHLGGRVGGVDQPVERLGLGGDRPCVVPIGRGRDVLVLAPAEQRRQRVEEAGGVAERPIPVELELEEVLAQEDHDLGPGQDPQVRGQAELERVLADDPVAEGMERRDRRVRVAVRDQLIDADGHLLGRLVGEGQGQDLRRSRTTGRDEPRDAPRDDLGLAGPRPRDHEQRPRLVGDRPALVRVEAAEERLEPRLRLGRERRVHDRHEVAPGGQLVEWRRFPPGADAGAGHRRLGIGWGRRGGHARTIVDRRVT